MSRLTPKFSPSTKHFYWSPAPAPADAVEVTAEVHNQVIAARDAGKIISADESGQPIISEPAPLPPPTSEQLAEIYRAKRDGQLLAMEPHLLRYERQLALGSGTSDSDEWYMLALQYVQDLRDVPQQPGFPEDIDWPVEPIGSGAQE